MFRLDVFEAMFKEAVKNRTPIPIDVPGDLWIKGPWRVLRWRLGIPPKTDESLVQGGRIRADREINGAKL